MSGYEEIRLGLLTPTRDFNYVKDTVSGFIAMYESKQTIGQEINIATQKEISIGQLAEKLIQQINPNARVICEEQRKRPVNSEVNRLVGANEKIKRLTGWQPQFTLEDGLKETIAFFKSNLDRYKTDIYNV